MLKQRDARMSRGGGTPGGVADEVAATEEAVARDFARQLVKMYVRRKREFLQAKSDAEKDEDVEVPAPWLQRHKLHALSQDIPVPP